MNRYFDAALAGDWAATGALWASGATVRLLGYEDVPAAEWRGILDRIGRDGELRLDEVFEEGALAAARWHVTAGDVDIDLCELLTVRDGQIARSTIYYDCSLLAAQMVSCQATFALRHTGRTSPDTTPGVRPEWIADPPRRVADGVWILQGGYPLRTMNVFLIEGADGVTVFDAGITAMTGVVGAAGDELGGIARVVLGHGHSDHRATAHALGAPVLCHPDEVADAEGDGGAHYMDLGKVAAPSRWVMDALIRAYDGPPPQIAGTVKQGDDVAGFEVIDLPGHAPGLIGLFRERDRLALVSDCVYLTDMDRFGKPGAARVPHAATSLDTALAAESVAKLAALDPALVWPGHLGPIDTDVRDQLIAAADAGAARP